MIQRLHRLRQLEVTINWGARGAKKTFKLVASDAPHDLVFQSLIKHGPMSDHNILSRHIKPAARKLGIGWVNWQVLRRSYATWMVEAGADPKAVQGKCDIPAFQPPWISTRRLSPPLSDGQSRR